MQECPSEAKTNLPMLHFCSRLIKSKRRRWIDARECVGKSRLCPQKVLLRWAQHTCTCMAVHCILIHFSYHLPSPHNRDYSQHIIVIIIYVTMIWIMRAEYKVTQWYCNVSCICRCNHNTALLCIFVHFLLFFSVCICFCLYFMNHTCRIQSNPVSLHCFLYLCVVKTLLCICLHSCSPFVFVFVCNVGTSKKKVAMENR